MSGPPRVEGGGATGTVWPMPQPQEGPQAPSAREAPSAY